MFHQGRDATQLKDEGSSKQLQIGLRFVGSLRVVEIRNWILVAAATTYAAAAIAISKTTLFVSVVETYRACKKTGAGRC